LKDSGGFFCRSSGGAEGGQEQQCGNEGLHFKLNPAVGGWLRERGGWAGNQRRLSVVDGCMKRSWAES
jgi:hypothetical protein